MFVLSGHRFFIEAEKLNSPDTFAKFSKMNRQITKKERELEEMELKVRTNNYFEGKTRKEGRS